MNYLKMFYLLFNYVLRKKGSIWTASYDVHRLLPTPLSSDIGKSIINTLTNMLVLKQRINTYLVGLIVL